MKSMRNKQLSTKGGNPVSDIHLLTSQETPPPQEQFIYSTKQIWLYAVSNIIQKHYQYVQLQNK